KRAYCLKIQPATGSFARNLIYSTKPILTDDPLAGGYYDGELIAALSTIKESELKEQASTFIKIQKIVNQLPSSDVNDDLRKDILKINRIIK
ncbi:contact-dependent growth inhibition system immunity protein, partial [Pantoea brenneri]